MDVQAFSSNAIQVSSALSWATEKVLLLRSLETAADIQAEEVLHWFHSTKLCNLVPFLDTFPLDLFRIGLAENRRLPPIYWQPQSSYRYMDSWRERPQR